MLFFDVPSILRRNTLVSRHILLYHLQAQRILIFQVLLGFHCTPFYLGARALLDRGFSYERGEHGEHGEHDGLH